MAIITGTDGGNILIGTNAGDIINADAGDDLVLGGNGNDTINSGSGGDIVLAGNGNDTVNGESGSDVLSGGNGNDVIVGGSGSDIISGDNGADTLDGSSGNDLVSGGAGNDVLVYRLSENATAADLYDGGAQFDTLRLELTSAQWANAAIRADVANYLAFLAGNPPSFQLFAFTAFDLNITRVESLQVVVDGVVIDPNDVDDPVTANADSIAATEDAPSAAVNLLANDSVPDQVASVAIEAQPANGSVQLTVDLSNPSSPVANAVYTPNASYQTLGAGETATDTFTYRVTDADGDFQIATATVTITGSNDAPTITGGDTSGLVQEDAVNQAAGDLAVFDPDNGAILSWTVQGGTSSADADFLFSADSLQIARNGNANFFVDNFDDGNPPPAVPVGTTTASGYGGSGVDGLQEAGGKLIFDSDNAVPFEGVGTPDPIVGLNAILRTNVDPSTPNAGLRTDDNFTVSAVYDLILPDSPRESYGLRLTDRIVGGDGIPPDQQGDDVIDIRLQMTTSGSLVVQLREVDFVADTNTIIEQVAFNAPTGADQIRFNLTHNASDMGEVIGSFDYLDDGVVVGSYTFTNVGYIFGAETPGFTGDDEDFTRVELIARAPAQSDSVISGTYGTLNINQAGQWTYNLDNSRIATQQLAQGQTETETFTVQVMDEHGEVDTETVTINVSGSNDGPVMTTSAVSRTLGEDDGTPDLTATGLAHFTDVDLNDTHTVAASLQSVVLSGGGALPAGLEDLLEDAVAASVLNPSTGEGAGDVQWDFALANSEVQFLDEGETLTATYEVSVIDNNGALATQTVTINVTGVDELFMV